jgi:phage-related minor tail protein
MSGTVAGTAAVTFESRKKRVKPNTVTLTAKVNETGEIVTLAWDNTVSARRHTIRVSQAAATETGRIIHEGFELPMSGAMTLPVPPEVDAQGGDWEFDLEIEPA